VQPRFTSLQFLVNAALLWSVTGALRLQNEVQTGVQDYVMASSTVRRLFHTSIQTFFVDALSGSMFGTQPVGLLVRLMPARLPCFLSVCSRILTLPLTSIVT
jgi:hypothetical protein